jgi:hypothetical protein
MDNYKLENLLLIIKKDDDDSISFGFNQSEESAVEISAVFAATMAKNSSFKAIIYTALEIAGDTKSMNGLINSIKK